MAEPGDLIEIPRGDFSHWVLYIGDGYIIHMTTDDDVSPEQVLRGIGASIGSSATVKAKIKKQKLREILAVGEKWFVNNSLDKKYKAKPVDVIVKEAELLVGTDVPYDLANNNCEHFVTNLRYGKPESRQVQDVIASVGMVGTGLGLGLLASFNTSRASPH